MTRKSKTIRRTANPIARKKTVSVSSKTGKGIPCKICHTMIKGTTISIVISITGIASGIAKALIMNK
jgi:adenine C2-methylase RlmN of 23S rRNA A2503 and tRNA A37